MEWGLGDHKAVNCCCNHVTTIAARNTCSNYKATNIQPTLLSDLRVVPAVQPSQEQGHYGMSNLMDSASNPRIVLHFSLKEQVTSASTTLPGTLSTSRPVNSAEEVTTGMFTTTAVTWGRDQSQCHHGKAFQSKNSLVRTGRLLLMTGYLFLKEQLFGMDGHKMNC